MAWASMASLIWESESPGWSSSPWNRFCTAPSGSSGFKPKRFCPPTLHVIDPALVRQGALFHGVEKILQVVEAAGHGRAMHDIAEILRAIVVGDIGKMLALGVGGVFVSGKGVAEPSWNQPQEMGAWPFLSR